MTAFISTSAPRVMSSGRENSFGEWLMPPTLGMKIIAIGALASLLTIWPARVNAQTAPTFETAVRPLLTGTCANCHNANLASGPVGFSSECTCNTKPSAARASGPKSLCRSQAGSAVNVSRVLPTAPRSAASHA